MVGVEVWWVWYSGVGDGYGGYDGGWGYLNGLIVSGWFGIFSELGSWWF